MSSYNFIRSYNNWHIETDGEKFRGHNQNTNTVTGGFSTVEELIGWLDSLISPPICDTCDSILVEENVTGIYRCLSCNPFYNSECRICGVMRIQCCC